MGGHSSKSPGGASSPPTDGGAGAPLTDQQDAATELSELTLELTDSDLNVLKSNPIGVSGDTLRDALSSIGHLVRGARPSLKLTFPVELFVRCVMNKMVDCTSGTDVGTVLSNLMKNEISAINEGIQKLRSAALHAAADNLDVLLLRIPLLMDLYSTNDPKLATEKDSFNRLAEAIVEDDLAKAFHTVETREEKIRCVVIACTALVAKAEPGGHSAAIIRGDLGLQIHKLFALEFLQHDVASQLDETHRNWLSFPKHRVSRLNSAVGALVHAEAFAAAHGLEPIMLEFLPAPFSIKVLVATGVFGGKTTAGELEGQFSPKELCVLGGLCDAPMPLAVTAAAASYFSGGGVSEPAPASVTAKAASYFSWGGASEPAPASAGGARNIGGLRELLEHINLAPDKAAEATVRAAAFCDEVGADSIGELDAEGPETTARFIEALAIEQPLKQRKLEQYFDNLPVVRSLFGERGAFLRWDRAIHQWAGQSGLGLRGQSGVGLRGQSGVD